jgi:hypothetical protein
MGSNEVLVWNRYSFDQLKRVYTIDNHQQLKFLSTPTALENHEATSNHTAHIFQAWGVRYEVLRFIYSY